MTMITRKQLRIRMLVNIFIAATIMVIITVVVQIIGYDMELPPIGLVVSLALFWTLEEIVTK